MIYGERVEKITTKSKWFTVRNLKKCNKEDLLLDLADAPWHVMETFNSIDDKYDYWNTLFFAILDKHAPLIKVRAKRDRYEWIDEDIHRLMRARNYHRWKYLKSRLKEDWEVFRRLRNEVNHRMRQAKAEYFSSICREFANHPKRVWRQLNSSLGRKFRRSITALENTNGMMTNTS